MTDPRETFAPLLDPRHMASAFQHQMPECVSGEWELTGCEIQHPRYKTYLSAENRELSSLSLVYHLHGRPPAAASDEQRTLFARAYLGNLSAREFRKAVAAMTPGQQGALLHFPALGVVGWRFPHDPSMPWLAELLEAGRVAALIPEAGRTSRCVQIEVVNYRPETRCTLRYQLRCDRVEVSVYGKTYADHSGARVHDNLAAMRLQSLHAGAFALPRPRGYDPVRSTLWLDELRGETLLPVLARDQSAALIDRLCQGLAYFHHMEVPHGEPITLDQQLCEWRKKARKLIHAYPALQASLSELLTALEEQRPEASTQTLIHGDFHASQLSVLNDGRMALFDFDELAYGDPWHDVANFAADLFVQPLPSAACKELAMRLHTTYQYHAQARDTYERFAWHLRGQLLTRAYRAHIQQKHETGRQVLRLVSLALRPLPVATA